MRPPQPPVCPPVWLPPIAGGKKSKRSPRTPHIQPLFPQLMYRGEHLHRHIPILRVFAFLRFFPDFFSNSNIFFIFLPVAQSHRPDIRLCFPYLNRYGCSAKGCPKGCPSTAVPPCGQSKALRHKCSPPPPPPQRERRSWCLGFGLGVIWTDTPITITIKVSLMHRLHRNYSQQIPFPPPQPQFSTTTMPRNRLQAQPLTRPPLWPRG